MGAAFFFEPKTTTKATKIGLNAANYTLQTANTIKIANYALKTANTTKIASKSVRPTMITLLYSRIRAAIDAHSGDNEAQARAVCDVVDHEITAATQDALSAYREDSPPPRRLGHTELEAAMRWCPLTREVTPVGKGARDAQIGNRYVDRNGSEYSNPAGAACIGSVCMFWRWHDDLRGYCGNAGPPGHQPLGEPRRLTVRTPLERPTASERVDLDDEAAR
jgi:hypothetical protein